MTNSIVFTETKSVIFIHYSPAQASTFTAVFSPLTKTIKAGHTSSFWLTFEGLYREHPSQVWETLARGSSTWLKQQRLVYVDLASIVENSSLCN